MKPKTTLSWMLRISLALTVGVMLLSPATLHAQVDSGSILGTVTDPSGALIGNATVTLTNEGTGSTLATSVGSDGGFKFTPVRIGSYKLSASSQGFQTTEQKNITVNVGSAVVVNFTMKPGQVTETVEVTSSTPVLETQDASVGQVVNSKSVNELPLNGRNFTFLAQLGAGVNSPQRTRAATLPVALSRPMAFDQPRTTTCSTASTTIPTPWTSLTAPITSSFRRSMRSRNSRFKPRASAQSSDAPAPRSSTPPSSPVPIVSTAPAGNFSATTNWTRRLF